MTDLAAKTRDEIDLADTGRHDVGHNMWLVHGREYGFGNMSQAKHSVASAVVDYRALKADDPWAGSANGNVRVDSIFGVEICQTAVRQTDLLALVQRNEVCMRFAQFQETCVTAFNRDGKLMVSAVQEVLDNCIGQPRRLPDAGEVSHFMEVVEMRFCAGCVQSLRHRNCPTNIKARTISNVRKQGI